MPWQTALTQRLKITHPIIQAPMAGGGDTPALVAAVSEAGGLGSIGAAYLNPSQILETGKAVRALTGQPFAVNFFAPTAQAASADKQRQAAIERIAPFFTEVGLPAPSLPASFGPDFPDQVTAALGCGASAFSFTFGLLPTDAVQAIKSRGIFLIGTATTVEEALALEHSGVDAVVAQGSEAGGHRGTFTSDFEAGLVGTMALVPQIVDTIHLPVIASGGIMDGRGAVAALALGAGAVQMGTAFLTCIESGIPEAYRKAILGARENQTRVTRAFSGRAARGIVNRFMEAWDSADAAQQILPFPLQNALTRPLRVAAAKQERAEFLSLWAGQATRLARRQTAAQLVARIARESEAILRKLDALAGG